MDNRQLAHEIIRLLRSEKELNTGRLSKLVIARPEQVKHVLGFLLKFGLIKYDSDTGIITLSKPMVDLGQKTEVDDEWPLNRFEID